MHIAYSFTVSVYVCYGKGTMNLYIKKLFTSNGESMGEKQLGA